VGAVTVREIYIDVEGSLSEQTADEVSRALWPTGEIPGELLREIKPRQNSMRRYDYQFIPGPIQTPAPVKPIHRRGRQRKNAKTAILALHPDLDVPGEKELEGSVNQYCLNRGWRKISTSTIGRALQELLRSEELG
jgi:hypothetical protein